MDILGDLPKEWIARWQTIQQASKSPVPLDPEILMVGTIPDVGCALAKIYVNNANVNSLTPLPLGANGRRPNHLIYYGTEEFPEENLRILVPVVKGLLTYKRSSRLSASQALQMLEQSRIQEGSKIQQRMALDYSRLTSGLMKEEVTEAWSEMGAKWTKA
ncbi:hypothetical protein LTR96_011406 [Exophiala xenobiotica]|nr:hypothetical protein LTR92_010925 [Exophiala xenobiotica]KAK5263169.1 hypothetical protein LTR96_011406 [Exophiala xenobiotica]KAK5400023.1 hypothetical protein LTR06_011320 [Exophiala xenobiotica]